MFNKLETLTNHYRAQYANDMSDDITNMITMMEKALTVSDKGQEYFLDHFSFEFGLNGELYCNKGQFPSEAPFVAELKAAGIKCVGRRGEL